MAEWYKLYIAPWNDGTSDLTLEQEAAYLRVINAIRMTELPIRHDFFVLGGLWRCNERKAKRLLSELIEAGKLSIEGRSIVNRRAVDEASNLARTRVERASAGSRGGVESGKSRSKSLKTNDLDNSLLQPDKTRQDNKDKEANASLRKRKSPARSLPDDWVPDMELSARIKDELSLTREEMNYCYQQMKGHAHANDRRQANWDQAFGNWLRKAANDGDIGPKAKSRRGAGRTHDPAFD